jgi:hypothetical protein
MQWGNGNVSVRVIDWDDRVAVRDFARVSFGCLRDGGTVITSPVDKELAGDDMEQAMDYVRNLSDIGDKLIEMVM